MTVQATNYDGSKSYNLLQDSDIVNNLTSGGTNKPLSAQQGKVLGDKLFRLVKIYNNSEVVRFPAASGFFDFLSKQNVIDKMGITEEQYNGNMLQFVAWNSDFAANHFYITGTMVNPNTNILKFRYENGAGASIPGRVTYVLMLFSDNDERKN